MLQETLNGDGTPYPAPVGSLLKGGGVIKRANPDGTYSVRKGNATVTMYPGEVFVSRKH